MMAKYGIIIGITIAFSVLDVLTGYLGAVIKKNVSSSKMRKGLLKKAVQVVVIACACLLQFGHTYVDLGINIPVVYVTCAFLIWMEATSILENADKILGGKLSGLIKKIKPKDNEDEDAGK